MADNYIETNEYRRLIHNDLRGAANWHLKVAVRKTEENNRQGVGLDVLASLVLHSFYAEALVNFVGDHVLSTGWPERASFREKVKLLNKVCGAGLSFGERPLQTVFKLKKLRDLVAHGKPDIGIEERVIDGDSDLFDGLRGKWKDDIKLDFLRRCSEDIDAMADLLFEKAGIEEWETVSRVTGSTKAITS